jgi:hypothetical protein
MCIHLRDILLKNSEMLAAKKVATRVVVPVVTGGAHVGLGFWVGLHGRAILSDDHLHWTPMYFLKSNLCMNDAECGSEWDCSMPVIKQHAERRGTSSS